MCDTCFRDLVTGVDSGIAASLTDVVPSLSVSFKQASVGDRAILATDAQEDRRRVVVWEHWMSVHNSARHTTPHCCSTERAAGM